MKKLFWTCALTIGALLLISGSASAQTVVMVATLNGGEETPALVLTGAVGTVEAAIDVTNKEISVTLRVFNIPEAGATTAGHFHVGPKAVGGPVVLDFPSTIAGRTGDFTMTFRLSAANFRARPEIGIITIDDMIQAMTGGNVYANVHTSRFPGGEIRGQLTLP